MNVVECDVPSGSMLSRDVIEHAYFRDSCRAPLSRRDLGIVDVVFAIFAHHPRHSPLPALAPPQACPPRAWGSLSRVKRGQNERNVSRLGMSRHDLA
jgi:hypothetical protein